MPGTGECTKTNVVYQATVTSDDGQVNTYIGSTNKFQVRYYAHRSDANNVNNMDKGTTLSKHIWKLKEERKGFNVSWRFVDRGPTYNPISRVVGPVSSSYTISFFIETCQHSKREMKYSICADIVIFL